MRKPIWIDARDALAVHDRVIAQFGGPPGVRDRGLLQSALARPQEEFAYGSPDVVELAALYTAGIVLNHPFIDGNKRTGFVLGVVFLELNGSTFTASEEAAAQAVLDLAGGLLDESGYVNFLRANAAKWKR